MVISSFKVKVCAIEINVQIVDTINEGDGKKYLGMTRFHECVIDLALDNQYDGMSTLWHELRHTWDWHTGYWTPVEPYLDTCEMKADQTGCFVSQILRENGDDLPTRFKTIWDKAKKEEGKKKK